MNPTPHDNYYLWDCHWCDSRNRTLWARIEEGKLVCGACYASSTIAITEHLAQCA